MHAVDSRRDWSIIKQLIAAGANLKLQDNRGKTALDHAENLKKMRKTAKYATKISILLLQEICQSKEKLKSKTEAQLDKYRGFLEAEGAFTLDDARRICGVYDPKAEVSGELDDVQ